jgi:uncharacterized protein YecE (DUF72 family)
MTGGHTRYGTATWNYPGWRGIVYPKDQPEKTTSAERLRLYAASGRFETVEADFTFYRPQNVREWRRYAAALPAGFPVVSKVWEEITTETFPKIERQKERAGQKNPNFLSAEAFKTFVLKPAEEGFGDHLGPFVFEFRKEWRPTPDKRKAFLDSLDAFFRQIPRGPRYAVELRTKEYLAADYTALLASHGASHVLNWWTHMPPLSEQYSVPGVAEAPFFVSRILVAPGRDYADAVRFFSPYDRIKEEHPEMRREAASLVRAAEAARKDLFLIVNNRSEGSAPYTIEKIREMIGE